jgi:DNA-binding MarR family transcriptional regulator
MLFMIYGLSMAADRLTRVTATTLRVLVVLVASQSIPDGIYALALARSARVHIGSIYPILARLEKNKWVSSQWELENPIEGKPRRRFYQLTDDGLEAAQRLLLERGVHPAGQDLEDKIIVGIGSHRHLTVYEGGSGSDRN